MRDGQRPVAITGALRDRSDPCSVVITLDEAPKPGWLLGYGLGTNPNVNLRDSRGFPAPMFGPGSLERS